MLSLAACESGGGSGGAPGAGDPVGGGGPPADPGPGEPTLVSPRAGLVQVHDVPAERLTASVVGRSVAVRVEWWSGVEPCYALAGVDVVRDGTTFTLTVREGTADPSAACIEIAMRKATVVELGELAAGRYTVTAFGTAALITVSVS